MTERRFYIGSLGPFLYDDSEDIDDPDGYFIGRKRAALVSEDGSEGIPQGVIVMWSGAIVDIPSGWYLCDGTNGTPDLTDKFIIGAGGTLAVAAAGANAIADVEAKSIGVANLPSHRHTISDDANHGGHIDFVGQSVQAGSGISVAKGNNYDGEHDHGGNTGYVGSGTALDVSPPYYALAFIMKG